MALDRLHVRARVLGVVEHTPERVEVAVLEREDAVRTWLADLVGLAWRGLPARGAVTGLEDDRVVVVADGLVVRPPWVASPAGFAGIELVVPRGMAFGSGEHGSTQAALCALEAVWPSPPPGVFADVGTGSGILALYARARGVARILACDVEVPAVRSARALVPGADVRLGGPECFAAGSADAVAANLDDAELDAALPAILALWNRSGPLVLAGVRPVRAAGHAARVGLAIAHRVDREGFVALAFGARR